MAKMGLQFGLDGDGKFCKRKFRWLFKIDGVSADNTAGANALPPLKSARPSLKFKEVSAQHLHEEVFYPSKPDWQNVSVTLYDLKMGQHPVFKWLKIYYNPKEGTLKEPNATTGSTGRPNKFILPSVRLEMYDGTGEIVETWVYEDVWPNSVNFQELEMGNSDVVTCELTLRYVRAYVEE